MKVVLGTRGSKLALAQTQSVKQQLEKAYSDWDVQIKIISTKGDQIQHLPLDKIGGKGLFVTEIEQEILSKEIQIGVHSLKDLPSDLAKGLCLTAPLCAATWQDALILKEAKSLAELAKGSIIATGSKRRKFQLLRLRPDLKIVDIRGNIDTRLRKMEEGQIDGLVLAAAGLERLNLQHRITHYFSVDEMIPACGQGILALEIREDQLELKEKIEALSDSYTSLRLACERNYLKTIGGGCHEPAGALVTLYTKDEVEIFAILADEEGKHVIKQSTKCQLDQAIEASEELAKTMRTLLEELL